MDLIEFVDSEIWRMKDLQSKSSEDYIVEDIQKAIESLKRYKARKLQKTS